MKKADFSTLHDCIFSIEEFTKKLLESHALFFTLSKNRQKFVFAKNRGDTDTHKPTTITFHLHVQVNKAVNSIMSFINYESFTANIMKKVN